MLEIEQLEKEWRRYKLKQFRPLVVTLLLLGGGAAATLLWPEIRTLFPSLEQSERVVGKKPTAAPVAKKHEKAQERTRSPEPVSASTQLPEKPALAAVKPATVQPTEKREKAPTPKTGEASVVLNPDTAFLSEFKASLKEEKPVSNTPVKQEVIPVANETSRAEKKTKKPRLEEIEPVPAKQTNAVSVQVEPKRKSSLLIQTKRTNNTLEYLIERFNQKRDPKLATYIAQSFYKKGNYNETVRWSIVANSLDPSSEESWLLFAQAKVKLGQKEDAINALRIYLNQYSSKKVKSYLQTLESGL
ncbi:CDC27 family protein [Hydrogenimonas urashimensis]|uniref:CDC27 family protein n=1 Tax=Hydrogenimonas urashimensis TaxID=2740515 RepID=UPI0019152CA5|nr:CDC27 family protein [Hydrogenimonas urashimensis]